jgi:hypothetical protein
MPLTEAPVDGLVAGDSHSDPPYRTDAFSSLVTWALPDSLSTFTTAGVLFNAENLLDFMRLIYVEPEMEENIQANYEQLQTLGRNIPLFGYRNTSGRTIRLTLYFMADTIPMLQVHRKVKWLQTFLYSRDSAKEIRAPKKVILCMGLYLWIKGVITEVNTQHKLPMSGLSTSAGFLAMFPMHAVVNLTIAETEAFWTGGQMTYEEAENETNLFGRWGIPVPAWANGAVNLL